ncbi:PQQ-dependent sugar dehydrogenase [Halomonas sp. YLGW01]|uniref:PQQ-dependent sugar dehydrogenase n=1 Tax=Halomonas sp. YLGW01 TaxID=2773308 RepID=UPI001F5BC1F7|nr:PQQ-dependent sugar dehydrogenase [Halomonas sp. YLGW01]
MTHLMRLAVTRLTTTLLTTSLLTTTSLAMTLLAPGTALAAETIAERLPGTPHAFRLERLAEGLRHPWSLAFLPDGRFLVSERPGRLALVDIGGRVARLKGVPRVVAKSQGGLLDLSLHPDFGDGEHDWLYFSYAKAGPGGRGTAVARARLFLNGPGGPRLEDVEPVFAQNHFTSPKHHYSGRLAWLPDTTLLLSIGDRGDADRAQDGADHAGSVLRLTAAGEAPADNPFVGDASVADEVFTLGNRNIQGLTVLPDGPIWSSEHGPRTGDEINRLEAGVNYGWPEVTLGRDYSTNLPIGRDHAPGMRDPAYVFEGRYAPSGLAWVDSPHFPGWRGNLLAGGLRSETLTRLTIEGDTVSRAEVLLEGEIGRIRDVRQGPDGLIYLLNDRPRGGLYRLVPVDHPR